MTQSAVLLVSGIKVYLEKESIQWHKDLGLTGHNKNEGKKYTIPIRSILFVRDGL